MNNEDKAKRYDQLLRMHDRLEERIADINSDAAGMDLDTNQQKKVNEYKQQIKQVLSETRALFN